MSRKYLFFPLILAALFGAQQLSAQSSDEWGSNPERQGPPHNGNVPMQPAAVNALVDQRALLVTHPGAGAGGADESRLQTTSLGMTLFGFTASTAGAFRVADDFVVPAGGFTIASITVYGYQTGSTTTSTFNNLRLQIWNGNPSVPGSAVVFGDTTTNRFSSTAWTNIYRTTETTVGNTQRPIMAVTASGLSINLPAGTYWLDYQMGGTLGSGPFAPPITILGQTSPAGANGLQWSGAAWVALDDGLAGVQPQDLPLTIDGVAPLKFNEALFNPPGTDGPNEYLEFRGGVGAVVPAGTYLVEIEGDGAGSGVVDRVFDLSGRTLGANGYMVFLQQGHPYSGVLNPQASVATATGTGWTGLGGANDIENGTISLLLITAAAAPAIAVDVDSDNNGVLDGVGATWTIVDAVAVTDNGAGDLTYGAQPCGVLAFTPGVAARIGESTGSAAADWVCSVPQGTPPTYTLSATSTAPIALASRALDHIGGFNFPVINADLSIVMTDAPDPVTAGNNVTYLVTMTNTGPGDAQNARFTVPLPAGTALVSTTPSAGGSCTAVSPIVCTWAGPTNAEVRTATIVASVPANTADGAFLDSSATAASDTPDPDPADNLSTVSTSVVTVADVSVTLADSPDPVSAGGLLTYVVTVSNLGPSDAQNVAFNLPLPTGTTFASVTASAGFTCNAASPVICSWAGPTVPGAGGNRTATITANVAPNLANGAQLIATVSASSDTTDLVSGNNEAEATTTVQTSADLAITLVDSPDPVIAGNQLTWVATLTNLGPSDAQGAIISLPLPLGTSFASASASAGGSCTTGNPVVCTWAGPTTTADTRIATIVANVASGQTAGLSATATAASLTNDPTPGNSTATADTVVQVQADLTITLTDAPDPVTAGTNLTYTATVANIGPSDATGVSTSMAVPGNTSFVSGTVSGGGSCGGTPVACSVSGSILPGSSRTITIVVLVAPSAPDGSTISAAITVTAGSPDPNPGNNDANTTTTVDTEADLLLSLTSSGLTALVNEPVTFTATSLNQGPSDAQNVSITLTLTPDFRYTSHVATGATCTVPQVGTTGVLVCTWAGATAPGVTRTLTVVAASNVEGPTGVNASTTSATPDPTPGNNSGNVIVQVGYLVEEIPTLSGYGLILLGLMFGLFGLAAVRRQA